MTWVCAPASSATGSSPCRAHFAGTARAPPDCRCAARTATRARRVVLMIANRWRILLTRYELRTPAPTCAGAAVFELCQLTGADREGLDRRAGPRPRRTIRKDLTKIAGERRAVGGTAPIWRRPRLEGGALPFHPRLLAGAAERADGRYGFRRARLNWRLVGGCCATPSSGRTRMKRRAGSAFDLALMVAAQLAYKLLGFAILTQLARGLGP